MNRQFSALVATLMLSCAAPAFSQSMAPVEINPPFATTDENGVDMTGGLARLTFELLPYSPGPNDLRLSTSIIFPSAALPNASFGGMFYDGMNHNYHAKPFGYGPILTMPDANGAYIPYGTTQSDGSIYYHPDLTQGSVAPSALYYSGSPAVRLFSPGGTEGIFNSTGEASQIIFPDGETWKLLYNNGNYAAGPAVPNGPVFSATPVTRLKFLISSRGYGIQFDYLRDSLTGTTSYNQREWQWPTRATFFNRATTYCDTTSLTDCAAVSNLSTAATIEYNSSTSLAIIRPARQPSGIQIQADASGNYMTVQDLTVAGSTKTYTAGSTASGFVISSYSDPRGAFQYTFSQTIQEGDTCCSGSTNATRSDPLGHVISTVSDINSTYPYMEGNEVNLGAVMEWTRGKISRLTLSDGNIPSTLSSKVTGFDQEDNRGNFKRKFVTPPPESGQATRTLATYEFPAECLNPKTCNKPTSVTDANNNTTSFIYDAAHGGVLTETAPADTNGIHPIKRYAYAQRYAWVKNSAGSYVPESMPIWVKTEERFCRTSATVGNACSAGATDEVIVTYDYGPNSGPNTLMLRSVVVASGTEIHRTCYTYDDVGNKISETKPLGAQAGCP